MKEIISIKKQELYDKIYDIFSLSFERDWNFLRASIKKVGILNPIIVRKKEEKFQIIAGKGRWLSSDLNTIVPLKIVNCKSDKDALDIYLNENYYRGFNHVEKAKILYKLHYDFNMSLIDISEEYSSILQINKGIKVIKEYLEILKLPNEILKEIATEKLNFKNALLLCNYSSEDALFLFKLSKKYKWTVSLQRELFSIIWEILREKDISLKKLIELIEKDNKKEDNIENHIKKMKNPKYFDTLEKFQNLVSQFIPKNKEIEICSYPYFDKPYVNVAFQLKNKDDINKKIFFLNNLKENNFFEKLFEIIS